MVKNIITTAGSVVLLAVVLFASCKPNSREDIDAIANKQEMPSLMMKNLESLVTDSGQVKYKLITPHLIQYDKKEEPYIDFPQGLHFLSYTPTKEVSAQIKCNNAIYWSQKELWELNNNVEAINEKGEILNTEQLFWDSKKHQIYTEKFVKITTATQILTGHGLEATEDLSWYEIKKPSGEFEISEQTDANTPK